MKEAKMENEVIITRTAKVRLGEDGIFRVIVLPKVEMTLADAKESIATVLKISKGKKLPLLVDSRNIKSMEREARVYYAGEEGRKSVSACALLIGSPVSRVIGNFFMGLNKPLVPTRLFTSETEAIEWLRRFIE
jgi:hypothetical protein